MLSASNLVTMSGGLTRDPEFNEGIGLLSFSIGVDGSGREGNETTSGYFDVKVWTNESKYSPAATGEYAAKAYRDGNLVKGARVNVIGRLVQERFETKDGKRASRINIVAEQITVVWSKAMEDKKNSNNSSEPTKVASASASSDDDDDSGYVPDSF